MEHYDNSELRLSKSDRPIGLERNEDLQNTCYLNTGMQCLNACPLFVAWVSSLQNNDDDAEFVQNVIYIIKVMRGIEFEKDKIIITIKSIQNSLSLTPGDQECSSVLIDNLINKLSNVSSNINIINTFELPTTNLRYFICGYDNDGNNINDLQTNYEFEYNNPNKLKMKYIVNQMIENDKNYKLSCIIVINIVRNNEDNKNPINLNQLMIGHAGCPYDYRGININEFKILNHKYELVAMSIYQPGASGGESGHYFAYAKHNGTWWKLDDMTVSKIEKFDEIDCPSALFYSLDCTNICPPLTTMED